MRAARVDGNHVQVVEALRRAGMTVQSLAGVGKGCPDLLVGFRGLNVLLEVKDGEKPPSARQLTVDETEWQQTWGGQVVTVGHAETAVNAVLVHCKALGKI